MPLLTSIKIKYTIIRIITKIQMSTSEGKIEKTANTYEEILKNFLSNAKFEVFDVPQLRIIKKKKCIPLNIFYLNKFVWIDQNADSKKFQRQVMSKRLKTKMEYFTNIIDAYKYINDQNFKARIMIITTSKFINQISIVIAPNNQVKRIFCFCSDVENFNKLKINKNIGNKFLFGTNDVNELIRHVQFYRNFDLARKSQQPNFVSLKNGNWRKCLQLKTIFAMLNEKIDKQIMVNYFCNLMKQIQPEQQEAIDKFRKESISKSFYSKDVIQWYCSQAPIYRTVKNLLRNSNSCTQLYYAQPFLKDLFQSLRQIHQQEKQIFPNKRFVCYRGAIMTEHEIQFFKQNVDQIIQCLGFMPATTDKLFAQDFAVNALLVINVADMQRKKKIDFGYINLRRFSCFKGKHEIVFNLLNTFRILRVSQVLINPSKKCCVIELSYGDLPFLVNQKQNGKFLSIKQNSYVSEAYAQIKQMDTIKTQIDVFRDQNISHNPQQIIPIKIYFQLREEVQRTLILKKNQLIWPKLETILKDPLSDRQKQKPKQEEKQESKEKQKQQDILVTTAEQFENIENYYSLETPGNEQPSL